MSKDFTKTISLPTSRMHQRAAFALVIGAAALLALFIPLRRADAALIDEVNSAIRDAGVAVTVDRSDAFQAGVSSGHYASRAQIVGAVAWHINRGTLPSFSATAAAIATECITGEVISFAGSNTTAGTISVKGDIKKGGGFEAGEETMNIKSNQYKVAIKKGISIGSQATVCSADNFYSLYGHVTKK